MLPSIVPLLNIAETVLMPGATLPLPFNLHDYSKLKEHLNKNGPYIGITLCQQVLKDGISSVDFFTTGTLAYIKDCIPCSDNKLILLSQGISRFNVVELFNSANGNELAIVDYSSFPNDADLEPATTQLDKKKVFDFLKTILNQHNISPNWENINQATEHELLTTITSFCPFSPIEKQAILEKNNPDEQLKLFMNVLEMAASPVHPLQRTIH